MSKIDQIKNNHQNIQSQLVSIRADKKIINTIRDDASRKNIPVSSYINTVLRDHINWHSYAARAGFIPFPKSIIVKYMDEISEENLVKIAESVAQEIVGDMMLVLKKEFTANAYLTAFGIWLDISGFPNTYEVNENIHKYVIRHDLGKKWSIYMESVTKATLEVLKVKKVEINTTPNIIICKCTI